MSQLLRAFKTWQYRGGRPQRWARIENRLWAIVFAAGLWNRAATLQVRGRRSGQQFSFPVAVVHQDGERFLVAMLGERTNWVRNVRATGLKAVLKQRHSREVVLQEVPVEHRAPTLRRYLDIAPGARPHFSVRRGAPIEAFERIAKHYPTFRVTEAIAPPRV